MDTEISYFHSKEEVESLKINPMQITYNQENKKNILPVNFSQSSFFSKIFYFWVNPVLALANKQPLEKNDVCKISKSQMVSNDFDKFKEIFHKQSKDKNKSYPLFATIVILHYKTLLLLFLLNIADVGLEYLRIFFFKKIISIFSEGDFFPENYFSLYKLNFNEYQFNIVEAIIIFIFIKLFSSLLYNYTEIKSAILNREIINETSALLMEKLLKSNSNSYAKGEGEKINLMEIDAEKIGFFFFWAPRIITFPGKIAISLYLLFQIFGHTFIYGLFALGVILAVIIFFQIIYNINIKYLLKNKDKRMKIVTYVFKVLKNIKLNNLDEEFMKRIEQKRDDEMNILSTLFNIEVAIGILNKNLNLILLTINLSIFVKISNHLEISSLFASFQLINTIAIPLKIIPIFLAQLVGNLVSIKRLQSFLLSEEHINNIIKNPEEKNIMIKFENISFSVKNKNLLEKINFTVKKGELIGIYGPTGSGKTCLLNAIMNNYDVIKDKDKEEPIINGDISFCPSQPWIMTETIKNNIIFYGEYNKDKYKTIIDLCCLNKDFQKLLEGDKTLVNSNCSNISEGQKIRISLARCLYQNKDIYLIDDIFSVLDKNISKKIFKEAITNFLKSKTRFIVINEKNYLSFVDKIIYLDKGKITFFGNYEKFLEFSEQNKEIINKNNFIKENNININKRKFSDENINNDDSFNNILTSYKNVNDTLNEADRNKISCKTYLFYIRLQGGFIVFIILTILIIYVKGLELYRSTIIPKLAKSYKEITYAKETVGGEKPFYLDLKKNFFIFFKLSLATMTINFIIRFTVTRISIYAMRNIHKKMISHLVKAPINLFHDVVPLGQILNRLTQDIEIIQNIIRTVNSFIKLLFTLAACMIICYIYNQAILIISPIIVAYIIILTSYYLTAGRNLTRLQRISYSPIMTIFSETIRGLDIIRTSHVEKNIKKNFFGKIDDRYGIYVYGEGCKRWHDVRRTLFIQLVFGVMILYMAYYSDYYDVRAIAIILQYTEEFLLHLIHTSLFYIELENSMIGLERCEQILKIPQENYGENKYNNIKIEEDLSENGDIEFINYTASYRPNTPDVLKNINLKIKTGEKIGIVGCSGSGKSTLINALARIIEPKNGKILINNIDIQDINLNILREKISILPQETFLIETNLRDNIDPLNRNTDNDIMKLINNLSILKNLENEKKLNFEIKENGNNLSTGEKKLICFARTVIKKNKIVIMDEITSSLDDESKNIISENINKYFKKCTLIMISNQLEMLKKCQRIIVIDNGEIIQEGKLEELLQDKNSLISSLIVE